MAALELYHSTPNNIALNETLKMVAPNHSALDNRLKKKHFADLMKDANSSQF